MTRGFRNISVTVAELPGGRFGWQLLEKQANDEWRLLEEGENTFSHYAPAMAAGLRQLQSLVTDLAVGPQADVKPRKPRDAAGAEPAGQDESAPDAAGRPSGKLFGFGPLR